MKKYLLLFVLFFFAASPAFAAVAHNHSGGTNTGTGVTTVSWSHTATGDNYLIVGLSLRGTSSAASCTYNSVSVPLLASVTSNTLFLNFTFGLVNPSTGANTVVCSWTGAANVAGISDSFSGVSSVGTVQTQSVVTSESDITATLGTNDMLWQGGSTDSGGSPSGTNNRLGTISPTATTTGETNGNSNNFLGAIVTGTGSVTNKIWTPVPGAGDGWASVGVPLVGAGAAAVVTPILYLLRAFWW